MSRKRLLQLAGASFGLVAFGIVIVLASPRRGGTADRRSGRDAMSASDTMNLDFELGNSGALGVAKGWYLVGDGYEFALDTTSPHSGAHSLRIDRNTASGRSPLAAAAAVLPVANLRGRRLRLRGFIRSSGVADGYAGIWIRLDDEAGHALRLKDMRAAPVVGSHGWEEHSVELTVDSSTAQIVFGAQFDGVGSAWFDSFELDVDGQPYNLNVARWLPSRAETDWIRMNSFALGTEGGETDGGDMRRVGAIVDNARITAFGEATHGTAEFSRMKGRILRYLVEHKGFTILAVEANMPEARAVNEYLQTGKGDPRKLLAGLYFWNWNAEEVLDVIQWMRSYNASGNGHIEFWGFDAQAPGVALDRMRRFFVRVDAAFVPDFDAADRLIRDISEDYRRELRTTGVAQWRSTALILLQHIESHRRAYVALGIDTSAYAAALQDARVVVQAAEAALTSGASRDADMAENVRWIVSHHEAGAKVVVWAHNVHIAKTVPAMGAALVHEYGNEIRVFGFAFGGGTYTAVGARGLAINRAAEPPEGTIEYGLRTLRIPRFVVDLRSARDTNAGAWSLEPHLFRNIGSVASSSAFSPVAVGLSFDALVYLDITRALKSFGLDKSSLQ